MIAFITVIICFYYISWLDFQNGLSLLFNFVAQISNKADFKETSFELSQSDLRDFDQIQLTIIEFILRKRFLIVCPVECFHQCVGLRPRTDPSECQIPDSLNPS